MVRKPRSNRPNILYIHSHDTGRYIQPYGHAVPTPNLHDLAGEGVLFRQAFCASPTCSPSRACLLTGQYAHCNGMLGLAHRGFRLNDYSHHLAHVLRDAGYATALAGFQHVTSHLEELGYDQLLGDHAIAEERACDFLDRAPEQPFFLSVGFFETHREFPPLAPNDDPDHTLPPAPLPDTPETRIDMARFKASARILDAKMGKVLDALGRNGLAENTLVICTTDHGIAFPGMKCNLTDGGIGVMLIMRGPGGFSGGKVRDALVSHIDIFPTICDLTGVPRPAWLQGESLLPLLPNPSCPGNEEIFAEVNYHAAYEPMRCVRTKRWKYVRRFDGRTAPVLPNCDDSPSKSLWLRHGWRAIPPREEALYDLVLDPNESTNLANDARVEEVRGEMQYRLAGWMRETDDPLLDGLVPAPPGARVNDPDGVSSTEEPRAIGEN